MMTLHKIVNKSKKKSPNLEFEFLRPTFWRARDNYKFQMTNASVFSLFINKY